MALDEYGLTVKQRLFCMHYMANGKNGTQAAVSAGYSKHTAGAIATENLQKPVIVKYVRTSMKETAEKLGITNEEILKRLYTGLTRSIPSVEYFMHIKDSFACLEAMQKHTDVKAGVAAASEINKMVGNYEPVKNDLKVTDISQLIEQEKKDH